MISTGTVHIEASPMAVPKVPISKEAFQEFTDQMRDFSVTMSRNLHWRLYSGLVNLIKTRSYDEILPLKHCSCPEQIFDALTPAFDNEMRLYVKSYYARANPAADLIDALVGVLKYWMVYGLWQTTLSDIGLAGDPTPYEFAIDLDRIFKPDIEKRWKQHVRQIIKERTRLFPNPKQHLFNRTDINPRLKREALCAYLNARSRIGHMDRWNDWKESIISFHSDSLDAAQRFFTANPHLAVSHLAFVLERWIEVANDKFLDMSRIRRGELPEKITLVDLLKNLHFLVSELQVEDQLPAFHNLSDAELFPRAKKGKDKADSGSRAGHIN